MNLSHWQRMMQGRREGNEITFALQFSVTTVRELSFHKLCMGMIICSDVHVDFQRGCFPPPPSHGILKILVYIEQIDHYIVY